MKILKKKYSDNFTSKIINVFKISFELEAIEWKKFVRIFFLGNAKNYIKKECKTFSVSDTIFVIIKKKTIIVEIAYTEYFYFFLYNKILCARFGRNILLKLQNLRKTNGKKIPPGWSRFIEKHVYKTRLRGELVWRSPTLIISKKHMWL